MQPSQQAGFGALRHFHERATRRDLGTHLIGSGLDPDGSATRRALRLGVTNLRCALGLEAQGERSVLGNKASHPFEEWSVLHAIREHPGGRWHCRRAVLEPRVRNPKRGWAPTRVGFDVCSQLGISPELRVTFFSVRSTSDVAPARAGVSPIGSEAARRTPCAGEIASDLLVAPQPLPATPIQQRTNSQECHLIAADDE
jgi:hypothetical protein